MQQTFCRRVLMTLATILIVLSFLAGLGLDTKPTFAQPGANAFDSINTADSIKQVTTAKYIFLFIGDGMGVAQRNAAELYLANKQGKSTGEWYKTKLLMNTFPAQGMTTTYDSGSIITDSASAGTAIATGNKTLNGVVSLSPDKKTKYTTIAEIAKQNGWKVGIVTSVSLDHATPAVFYAHMDSRSKYYEIAEQMVQSGFNYFAGGGLVQPKGKSGSNADNLVFAERAGYTITKDRDSFEKLSQGVNKVIAINEKLDTAAALDYAMDTTAKDISLAEFTKKGIELLDNPTGFFMMVEGGKIDWACHANDAAASIHDTLAFDDAIAEAYAFYQKHPNETVIIVTGDHETGGMAIGYAGTGYNSYFDKISYQTGSYVAFDAKLNEFRTANPKAKFMDVMPLITENFGLLNLTDDEKKTAEGAVKKGSAADASDADKAAAKEAKTKLAMNLNSLELSVLEAAFVESMKPAEERVKGDTASLLYGGYEPLTIKLTTILNNKAGIGWTSYAHTGSPVQTSAIGVGAEIFEGYYDNTEIFSMMMSLAGFK